MCGIAAIFNYATGEPVQRAGLNVMLDDMRQRGPDGVGEWFGAGQSVALGHRRLAIIDLSSAGAQPMPSADGRLVITFNGEIYNYLELRAELEGRGCRFQSHSDTEVLLHLYQLEGEAMLEKLRGMYAFALWDDRERRLFLARDPFGIKPLYWADDGRTIRAASQVKAILAAGGVDTSPEPAGHVGYFLWGHVPEPYTLYRGIRNLPAGHSLTVGADGKKVLRPFRRISGLLAEAESETSALPAPTDSQTPLRQALADTVRHHLIADVPVGVFLSSGLDSTTIAALAAESGGELRTVTLGFEEFKGTPNDETPLAEEVARRYHAKHQTVWVTRKDFENDMHRLFQAMDQPSSDGVNSYFISKAAAQAGLKVVLSGLGGDELFGSYPSFREIPRAVSMFRSFRHCRPLGKAIRIAASPILKRMTSPKYAGLLEFGGSYGGAYLLRRGMFMPWELPGILDPDMVRDGLNELQTVDRLIETVQGIQSPHLKISALEMSWYMRHQLLRDTDWASMAHSLEVRVPFVDVNLLRSVAPMFLRKPSPTKREMALTPNTPLPASVLGRPKSGFVVPVRDWLLKAFDPVPGSERGLRGWTREVYSHFGGTLANHQALLRRQRRRVVPVTTPQKLRSLVLLTDGFGGFGGISKFNRDFLAALCADQRMEKVVAVPRLMPHAPGELPAKLDYVTAGLGGKRKYVKAVIAHAKKIRAAGVPEDQLLIFCAHIHLLPIALLARRICGGSVHLIIYGVDAWTPTKSLMANAMVRKIDGFISISHVTKRRFMRWSRLREDQGVLLPCCADLPAFAPGPKSADLLERYHLQGRTVLMTFGRLASEERYKGFDEVLAVLPTLLADIPNLSYLICGDGPDRQRLVQKALSLGLMVAERESQKPEDSSPGATIRLPSSPPQVVFAGRISDAEKADHYRLADVYVMPSSGEGFGIVFLEALACGIPVIGSQVDGSREALLNGRLGLLVDPRDHEEIIAAIRKTLNHAPNGELPKNMDGYLRDFFSTARYQQRVGEILDGITN